MIGLWNDGMRTDWDQSFVMIFVFDATTKRVRHYQETKKQDANMNTSATKPMS